MGVTATPEELWERFQLPDPESELERFYDRLDLTVGAPGSGVYRW